jgi:hypothetical protein
MTTDRDLEYLAGLVREFGTGFSPSAAKKGNEPLETWLLRLLTPKIHFRFFDLLVDGKPVALLEIGRAFRQPVRFQNEAFIRVGQVKKPLKDVPDRERFGIVEKNAAVASRLLNEAMEAGMIVVRDPEAGTRNRTYLPYWAAPSPAREGIA